MNKHIILSTFVGLLVGYYVGTQTSNHASTSENAIQNETVSDTESTPISADANSPNQVQIQEKIVYRDKECPTDPSDQILPAPSLSKSVATPMASNHEGEVRVAWNTVPHASRYRIQVLDVKGNIVKNYTTPRSALYLKELAYEEGKPFTPYWVVLSTVNRNNEEGALSPRYEVRIKPLKNLTAPTINEISVEN